MTAANEISWTNPSVLSFAGNEDPIEAIERAARNLVIEAREAGWEGPPFNPVFLAHRMGVPIEANANIADARTISTIEGARIEYNPRQARERVRFSIAHEIAHLLFPDASERTRNRGGTKDIPDDWQLEMLCNLAASEFVMPFGSLPTKNRIPPIEALLAERRNFDVSAEAFLIRVVKTATIPIAMFCASPVSETQSDRRYRIDYTVPSITAPATPIRGYHVPVDSVVHYCTAIGYTDSATESWVGSQNILVECVGIPGYPGSNLPRVAGLIRYSTARNDRHPIRYVHGNALDPRGDGKRLVCQMVNDRARKWGGGMARSAAQKFPKAEQEFAVWLTARPMRDRLGKTHFSTEQDGIVLASLIAQEGFGKSNHPRIRYAALSDSLQSVAQYANDNHYSVHMPRIGTGAAGGIWEAIEEIIDESLVTTGLFVTVYDPPPRRRQLRLFD